MPVLLLALLLSVALGGWAAPVPDPEPWIQPWIRGREKEFEILNSTDVNAILLPEIVKINETIHRIVDDVIHNATGLQSGGSVPLSGAGQLNEDYKVVEGDAGLSKKLSRKRRTAHATPEASPVASPIPSLDAELQSVPDSVPSGSPDPKPVHSPLAYASDKDMPSHERRKSSGPNAGSEDKAYAGPNPGPNAEPNSDPQGRRYYYYTDHNGERIYYTHPESRLGYDPSHYTYDGTSNLAGYNRQNQIYGTGYDGGYDSGYVNEYPNHPNSYDRVSDRNYVIDYNNGGIPITYQVGYRFEQPGSYDNGYLPGDNPYYLTPTGFQQPIIENDYNIPSKRPYYIPDFFK